MATASSISTTEKSMQQKFQFDWVTGTEVILLVLITFVTVSTPLAAELKRSDTPYATASLSLSALSDNTLRGPEIARVRAVVAATTTLVETPIIAINLLFNIVKPPKYV